MCAHLAQRICSALNPVKSNQNPIKLFQSSFKVQQLCNSKFSKGPRDDDYDADKNKKDPVLKIYEPEAFDESTNDLHTPNAENASQSKNNSKSYKCTHFVLGEEFFKQLEEKKKVWQSTISKNDESNKFMPNITLFKKGKIYEKNQEGVQNQSNEISKKTVQDQVQDLLQNWAQLKETEVTASSESKNTGNDDKNKDSGQRFRDARPPSKDASRFQKKLVTPTNVTILKSENPSKKEKASSEIRFSDVYKNTKFQNEKTAATHTLYDDKNETKWSNQSKSSAFPESQTLYKEADKQEVAMTSRASSDSKTFNDQRNSEKIVNKHKVPVHARTPTQEPRENTSSSKRKQKSTASSKTTPPSGRSPSRKTNPETSSKKKTKTKDEEKEITYGGSDAGNPWVNVRYDPFNRK